MLQVVTRAQAARNAITSNITTETAASVMAEGRHFDFSLCPDFQPRVTDPEDWLSKFDTFTDIYGINEENKLKCLTLKLQGPVYDWLKSLPDGQKDTWAHFCTAFRARWVDKANNWSKVGQIFHLKQDRNQDVREFITNAQQMAAKVDLPETQLIQALLNGIKPKLRPEIQRSNPKNLQDFIKAATIAQTAYADSEDPQAPAVETFITALEPYLKKQINEITENLEKKISSISVSAVSPQNYTKHNFHNSHKNPRNQAPRPQPSNNSHPNSSYNRQFQPRNQQIQFRPRPTLPFQPHNQNTTRTFNAQSWQQSRPKMQRQTYNLCRSCNASDHRRQDCPNRYSICTFCGYQGHIEIACGKKLNAQ